MASNYTITAGYSHASGGLVTPTRLNTAITGMILKPAWVTTATSATATSNQFYLITGDSVTLTLPAAPSDLDFVEVAQGAADITGLVVARNGKTIMGESADLTVDVSNFYFRLTYIASTGDWRIT